jgi:hypothetical protein
MTNSKLRWIAGATAAMTLVVIGTFATLGFATTGTTWQPLMSVTDNSRQIIIDNTAPSADHDRLEQSALSIELNGLMLVDFNSPTMCGAGGCALLAYRTDTQEQILATYIKQGKEDEALVEIVENEAFDLPCLLIPADDTSSVIESDKDMVCYDGDEWNIQP